MAWNQVTLIEKKLQFVSLAAIGRFTFTELCAEFHVSRKTGHEWRERYRRDGAAGLHERSRRPHGCSHQTAARIEQLILRERGKYRSRGPLMHDGANDDRAGALPKRKRCLRTCRSARNFAP
jgi:hypothetical protein